MERPSRIAALPAEADVNAGADAPSARVQTSDTADTPGDKLAGEPWWGWAVRLRAMAETGLTFTTNPYDRARYRELSQMATSMLAELAEASPECVEAAWLPDRVYPTPYVDVRAAVFRGDDVLLVRERSDGGWSLPGGWADVGDSPAEVAVREVREESGYVVAAAGLVGVYDRSRHGFAPRPFGCYIIVVACALIGGEPSTSHETDGVGFFAFNGLPALSPARGSAELLDRVFAHRRDPRMPADLD